MSFAETVGKIVHDTSQNREPVPLIPTLELQTIIDKSKIQHLFDQLSSLPIEVKKEVIEDGKKMIIVAEWGDRAGSHPQITISITESSISFIGNTNDNQYIRLEEKNMRNSRKIKESLKNTFSNPQII